MLKSHDKFHSSNGKRLILVVDDEPINREMLGMVLASDYELIYAEDGLRALDLIWANRDTLSLILLDLMMPGLSGIEVLQRLKADPEVARIPVIVLTADQNAEVESLSLGATDFIPKPYPQSGVILARIRRTIELSEDRQIIQSTERDPLTGLYNREYFYRYAEQFDQHHKALEMDAIVVDVNHFHMINERFGTAYGDDVLRRIGEKVREMVQDTGGIVCRREADTFMVYCPHGKDYKAILENATVGLAGDDSVNNRVRLRMGVYANVDKSLDIQRRFDRAKMAADTVRNSFTRTIGIYDIALHEQELYAEQLIEDFAAAINERQFKVFYQPKFDVRPEIPVLASAEALVRWQHPTLGMISPGVFIPLFEDNGLIQALDHYVWRTAAAQIKDWKERLGFTVPVSVNVSRIDMYEPELAAIFQSILRENGLSPSELLLEITESAYTQDSEQIIGTVNNLRKLGFRIEMDDFGTGYSSLNMISTLPIDALKLDMQFIRNAFSQRKDTRMLEVIIDIADYLSVPVIAEGVETEEQLHALKAMGCDLVQGFYFSRPVPPQEYERFVAERRDQHIGWPTDRPADAKHSNTFDAGLGRIAYALSSGFESVYYVDTDNDHYFEFSSEGKYEDLQIERSGSDFFADTQRNIPRVVYAEDVPRVSLCMQKPALLAQLSDGRPYSLTYRLVIDGVPTYYNLKIVKANTHDDHHIVIGVSNVDEQIRQAGTAERSENELDFNSLAKALSSDMESIYYVDTETDTYMEFVAEGSYGTLKLEISGTRFFDECQKNIRQVVFPEDQDRVAQAMRKHTLLGVLESRQSFTADYRLVIDGVPLYYRMKVIPADGADSRHIIIGVSNIDAQITEEQRLEAQRQSAATYSRVAQALAQDYFSIYYVDTETDRFIEYSSYDEYSELGIEKSGEDFFNLSRKNMERVGHPDDLAHFFAAFTKENVMRELERNGTFTIGYRLMFEGVPNYVRMKITSMGDNHIVVGVNNVNAEMRRQQEYEEAMEQNLTYSRIAQALSKDYYSIYYVNIETDEFIEYSSQSDYQELKVEQSGVDFFEDCRRNILRLVYKDDLDKALAVWDKARLLPELENGNVFSTTYRLLFDGVPVYINCKVIRMDDDKGDRHIVIGVSNVDAQMHREQELTVAQERANRDALTGVKSKYAYVESEQSINQTIADGIASPFAMVICDVNGLKAVNDTQGHAAGDALIRSASSEICNIFAHSPVFRYGGDEFVVILRGRDYEHRAELTQQLAAENRKQASAGGVVIACGLSEYIPGQDTAVAAVFERADAAMYENKKSLKQGR
ncbi:MAG: EAL domain-containing protein [Oscillospiraceae bacterium]|nr:EAL domain-containing protein [Oscillospiraceae bacterium]